MTRQLIIFAALLFATTTIHSQDRDVRIEVLTYNLGMSPKKLRQGKRGARIGGERIVTNHYINANLLCAAQQIGNTADIVVAQEIDSLEDYLEIGSTLEGYQFGNWGFVPRGGNLRGHVGIYSKELPVFWKDYEQPDLHLRCLVYPQYAVVGVHIANGAHRDEVADHIVELLQTITVPVLVVGDWNTRALLGTFYFGRDALARQTMTDAGFVLVSGRQWRTSRTWPVCPDMVWFRPGDNAILTHYRSKRGRGCPNLDHFPISALIQARVRTQVRSDGKK